MLEFPNSKDVLSLIKITYIRILDLEFILLENKDHVLFGSSKKFQNLMLFRFRKERPTTVLNQILPCNSWSNISNSTMESRRLLILALQNTVYYGKKYTHIYTHVYLGLFSPGRKLVIFIRVFSIAAWLVGNSLCWYVTR